MSANYKPIILAIGLLFALAASVSAAPGDLDPTFGNGGKVVEGSVYEFYDVAIQPDGKIVAVGIVLGGTEGTQIAVARYNINGSPDMTFGGTGRVLIDRYGLAIDVAIQPDGKIVVASRNNDGEVYGEVLRLNSDGSLDTSFGTNGIVASMFLPSIAATLPDGKLLIDQAANLLRFNANGSVDSSFNLCRPGGGISVYPYNRIESVIQADGKILTVFTRGGSSGFGVFRCNADGTLDTGFGSGGVVITPMSSGAVAQSIAIQVDGKIVVAGQSGTNTDWEPTIVRYNPNGSLDTGFGTGGILTAPSTGITGLYLLFADVVIQADGKIVLATTILNGSKHNFALVRYNPNGSLDTTFNGTGKVITPITNGDDYALSLAIQADGKFVVVGASGEYDFDGLVVRYQGDSALPPSCPNPIDCPDFFARQHYQDFLGREPDPAGLSFWTGEITSCGTDPQCIEVKRVNVSAAFFLSIEFQQTGFYALRLQRAAFGHKSADSSRLTLASFLPDARALSDGVVVGIGDWEQRLELNKQTYAERVAANEEFAARFPATQTPAEFVAALYNSAGVTPTQAEADAAVAACGGGSAGRAAALRKVAESESVTRAELNPSFVLMEYFGYLRRDPDDAGYGFWLAKLEQFGGDYVKAEMVKAFLSSDEYRRRFGQL